jgi:hypothetical protein
MFKHAESMQAMIARGADPSIKTGGPLPCNARRWSRNAGTEAVLNQHGVPHGRYGM